MKREADAQSEPGSSRPGGRRRAFCVLILMLVLLLPIGYVVWQSQARTTIVGKTDPKSGYRCIYTVSSSWKKAPSRDMTTRDLEAWEFHPPEPAKWRQWIDKHLLHRNVASAPGWLQRSVGSRSIREAITMEIPHGIYTDGEGYPTLNLKEMQGMQVLKQEHFQVDGQPAAWFVLKMPFSTGVVNDGLYICALAVTPRKQSTTFSFAGVSPDSTGFPEIVHEMEAIRASLRLEQQK